MTRSWMSPSEREEAYQDHCAAYQGGYISLEEFQYNLGMLGYNATEIADAERFYRPSPPEGKDDTEGD